MKKKILQHLIILIIICYACNNQQHQNKLNKTDFIEEKNHNIDFLSLIKTKQNNENLEFSDISNIDKIGGFRNAKLGLNLDTINYSGCHVDSTLADFDIIEISDYAIFQEDLKIGNNQIQNFHLHFFQKKLSLIEIEYGTNGTGALSMFLNIYGQPSNYDFLEKKIEEKVNIDNLNRVKDERSILYHPPYTKENTVLTNTPYIWETDKIKVTYTLEKKVVPKSASTYGVKEYNTCNLMTVGYKDFHTHLIEVHEELLRNEKKEQKLEEEKIKKEQLNEF